MIRFLSLLICSISLLGMSSCDDDLEVDNTVAANFEELWSTIDRRYCFFPFKKDSIMDWNRAHDVYLLKAYKCKTMEELFYVFADLLNELKDGHVNLISSFDVSRYDLQGDYEENFVKNVIFSSNYLGRDYRSAGGLYYKLLAKHNIGYVYYPSFSNSFSESNINNVLRYFGKTKGLIIDIRGNGGGLVTNVEKLASHFVDVKTFAGYYKSKNGPGHDDFSSMQKLFIHPSDGSRYLDRPVVVLTNRDVYSAANNFAQVMKSLPNVVLVGDVTGGGCGMPFSSELPCGWTVRFSSAIYYDTDGNCTEWGVEPDVFASLDKQKAYIDDVDSIIETACLYIADH